MYGKPFIQKLANLLTMFKGRQVVLEILDTAGTEQFSELTKKFFTSEMKC
jgi:hypothetical protein